MTHDQTTVAEPTEHHVAGRLHQCKVNVRPSERRDGSSDEEHTADAPSLPILRDNRLLEGHFGKLIMAGGAVGEFLPIVATAVFLSTKGAVLGLISLTLIGGVALLFTLVPRLVHNNKLAGINAKGEHATSQTTLRWTMFLLFALLVIAADFGLDVVLGAFLAGVVLRRWAPGDVHALEAKLDAVGYGFFIPVFFVTSGMSLHLQSIIESPARLIVFYLHRGTGPASFGVDSRLLGDASGPVARAGGWYFLTQRSRVYVRGW